MTPLLASHPTLETVASVEKMVLTYSPRWIGWFVGWFVGWNRLLQERKVRALYIELRDKLTWTNKTHRCSRRRECWRVSDFSTLIASAGSINK